MGTPNLRRSTVINIIPRIMDVRMSNLMLNVTGDMTPEGGEESKVGERSTGENIVTMVTMEQDMEEVSEDTAAEAQDYFKEGYSSELAQVFSSCLYHKSNYNYTISG